MKKNLKIMSLMGIITFITLTNFILDTFDQPNNNYETSLKNAGYWDLTGTPILINDLNPSNNWTWAVGQPWCSGSGTWSDPYIIENVTIDGQTTARCLTVRNSNVYFIIRNCTLFNSKDDNLYGGIFLENVNNGTIENNNCSNNGRSGMWIETCNNITITGNTLKDNGDSGIALRYSHQNNISINTIDNSHNAIIEVISTQNIISENTIDNGWIGVYLSGGNHNNVTDNKIYNNGHSGIYFSGDSNIIVRNTLYYNDQGIFSQHSNFNTVSDNIIYNSTSEGIYFIYVDNSVLSRNNLSNNEFGIWLSDQCDYNNFTNNEIHENNNSGIYIEDAFTDSNHNLFYNNSFIKNGINAFDGGTGTNNKWNKTNMGNFWDDYTGIDQNDDGIGDSPYNISGIAGGQDHFPLWDDGHNGSKIAIDDSASNNWNWAKTRTWCSGSGTLNDPYTIKNLIIDGLNLSSCITIENSDVFFKIENCTVFNSATGLNHAGIKLDHSNNGTLIGNNCSNNNGNGIYIWEGDNSTIIGNIVNHNVHDGIHIFHSDNSKILGNNISYNDERGIQSWSDDSTISGNNLNNNNLGGIIVAWCQNSTILGNLLQSNSMYGIFLSFGNNHTVLENLVRDNTYGIMLYSDSYNNTVSRNTITESTLSALYLYNCEDNFIIANLIKENYDFGLTIHDSNNSFICGNILNDNVNGWYNEINSFNNTFHWNVINNESSPFTIDNSGGGDFKWDQASNKLAWCSGSGTFKDPYTIKNLIIDGLNLSSCITIKNSDEYFIIVGCITFNSSSGLDNAGIVLINVINGQLISNNFSNNNGNGMRLSDSQNITISGNTAGNNDEYGIFLATSHNNSLSGNVCNENYYSGIYLGLSTANNISDNSAFNNIGQRGIYLESSSNHNWILNNNFSYNDEGIFIAHSHNNTVIGNTVDHNDYGMWLWESNNNTIIGNTLSNNDLFGLRLYRSNNTDVISNSFIGNLFQHISEFESVNNNFILNYFDGMLSPFVIDNNGGGDLIWVEAADLFIWCTGSGSYSDPFIIQNLIIDGQNSSSCIEIRDSTVFFKIVGCTLSNSGSGVYNAGIKLTNVINGQLITNNCSNNNGVGIGLYQSQNVTIDGNIVNNNDAFGIFLEVSHNNILSGNILNENSDGMYLGLSNNNTISENSAFNNDQKGIYLSSSSNNNTIMNNNVTFNGDNGIDIYDGQDIKVVGNIVDNNGWNGIFVWNCNNAIVASNIANYNTFAGLYLWSSNNTKVIGNVFIGNLYSIYESGGVNNIFNWNVENGFTDPIIIDDSGTGDFTWVECISQLAWIYGSGTLNDPYIIGLITIDGLNSTSCLTIRNSNVDFRIENCTFYNSGDDLYDGGIKLDSTINGELIYNNCSFNNANGIILDSCQNILITENSINNNERSGIVLIDCSNIDILNNKETINFNELYGIHLSNSHYNNITNNIINNNGIGIFLDQSNYNSIDWNTLLNNGQAIVDTGVGNDIGLNNILPSGPSGFPFDILIIILIIGLVVVGVTGAAIIIKKRISIPTKKAKEISEKKKEKIRAKLEGKLEFVDYLIRERKIQLAYKNLGKIQDTADMYDFYYIFNKASEKVEYCKELEAEISKPVIKEEITTPAKEREVKKAVIPPPIIKKEEEKKYNLFISYSTADRDHFQIEKIVSELKKYPNINQVSYWERDSKANIVEFMEETLRVSNIFILFCSENSLKSKAVTDEWQAAFQMRKEDLLKMIPVFEDQKHIPRVLWHLLNVKYTKDGFKRFIENLYKEIMRE